ncbi:hypothetical protein CBS101457_002478 [Exobasidium rhododendri]|nr:hypothetical protein CBS101457_002478 [Exobasidium rhododendri]
MFSVVVAGRLPLPAPQQIDQTHALFPLEDVSSINHVTVFMTGEQAFPPGYAATVHLNWKSPTDERWILLGCLKNEKPSAIFRIKGLTQHSTPSSSSSSTMQPPVTAATNTAAIGISLESAVDVDTQMANLKGKDVSGGRAAVGTDMDGMQVESEGPESMALIMSGPATDTSAHATMALALAPRIANNAFSYLSSFAPDSAPQTVPLLKKWLEQFERKIKGQGIGFLAKEAE